jgi:hypothetical protein
LPNSSGLSLPVAPVPKPIMLLPTPSSPPTSSSVARRPASRVTTAGLAASRRAIVTDAAGAVALAMRARLTLSPRREVGRVHAAEDVLARDRLHPGLVAAGRVGTGAAAGLDLAHVAVVARGEALDQLDQRVGLLLEHGRHHVVRDHVLVEEVGVDVLRPADGAAERDLRVGAEVARALAAVGEEGVGHGAQVVLRLRIAVAVARAGPVVRLDVRHAHRGAADLGLVGGVLGRRRADRSDREEAAAASSTAAAGDQQRGRRGHRSGRECEGERPPPAARIVLSHVGCLL